MPDRNTGDGVAVINEYPLLFGFGEGNGHRKRAAARNMNMHIHTRLLWRLCVVPAVRALSRGSASSGCVIYPVEQGASVRRSTASFNCKIFGRGSHKGEHTATYHGATLDNLTRAPDDRRCSSGGYSSLLPLH